MSPRKGSLATRLLIRPQGCACSDDGNIEPSRQKVFTWFFPVVCAIEGLFRLSKIQLVTFTHAPNRTSPPDDAVGERPVDMWARAIHWSLVTGGARSGRPDRLRRPARAG